jgi:hypothetical protein
MLGAAGETDAAGGLLRDARRTAKIPTPAMAAVANAIRQSAARRPVAPLPRSRASLRALSPAMSECDGLVASPTPDGADVLVTA